MDNPFYSPSILSFCPGFLGLERGLEQAIGKIKVVAYVEIEATYLLPAGSLLKSIADVDARGVRIAVPERSAYELWLTRNIKNAELVRVKGSDAAYQKFVDDKLDALAGLRPGLIKDQARLAGSTLLLGNFTAVLANENVRLALFNSIIACGGVRRRTLTSRRSALGMTAWLVKWGSPCLVDAWIHSTLNPRPAISFRANSASVSAVSYSFSPVTIAMVRGRSSRNRKGWPPMKSARAF